MYSMWQGLQADVSKSKGVSVNPCTAAFIARADHNSILLLPAYRQKLKQEAPSLRSVQRWSNQSDSMLQDCFDHVDWDMFRIASNNNID